MDYRERLLTLAAALGASLRQLTRDECGDYRIQGQRGHIYVDGEGYLLVIHAGTARMWTEAKRALHRCQVTQDGDDEGCLHMDHLPDEKEAAEIRHYLKLRKRRDDTPETLDRIKNGPGNPGSGGSNIAT